jgi:hypothetical protein
MPLKRNMDYTGRRPAERGPHQIAAAMAAVLEAFATASRGSGAAGRFDVGEHPELEAALLDAGEAVSKAVSPNAWPDEARKAR